MLWCSKPVDELDRKATSTPDCQRRDNVLEARFVDFAEVAVTAVHRCISERTSPWKYCIPAA